MSTILFIKNHEVIDPVPDSEVYKTVRANRPEDSYQITPLCRKHPDKVIRLVRDY